MNHSGKSLSRLFSLVAIGLLVIAFFVFRSRWQGTVFSPQTAAPAAQATPEDPIPSTTIAQNERSNQSPLPTPANPERPVWNAQDLRIVSDEPLTITAFSIETSGNIDDPVWSPDSQAIILNRLPGPERGISERELWAIRLDGSGEFIGRNALAGQWSPDGSQIAYLQRSDNDFHTYSLWITQHPNSELRRWLADTVGLQKPSWRSDGTILFPEQSGAISQLSIQSESKTDLASVKTWSDPLQGQTALLSPDNTWLVVRSQENIEKLLVYSLDKPNEPWTVPMTEDVSYSFIIGGIAWSPDSSKIAFHAGSYRFGESIHVVDVRSRQEWNIPVRQIGDISVPHSLSWSPDSQVIAFGARNENTRKTNLYVINADGSNLRSLSRDENLFVRTPVWSPNGAYILYSEFTDQDARARPRIMTLQPNEINQK